MEKKLKKVIDDLSKIKYVLCIFLFGSYVSGKFREDSDIDIAVLTKKITKNKEYKIMGFSSELFDVSVFSRLPLIIQFRILREGKIVFCRDEKYLRETKFKVIRDYLDFSYLIKNFYKKIIENA